MLHFALEMMHFAFKMMNCALKMMDFAFNLIYYLRRMSDAQCGAGLFACAGCNGTGGKMMIFLLETFVLVLKLLDLVPKMFDFVLKMLDFAAKFALEWGAQYVLGPLFPSDFAVLFPHCSSLC